MKVLPPIHTDEASAYVVVNYPWGFVLKTSHRYWIETRTGFGQRLATQTLNPKSNRWCKPKYSTYCNAVVLYIDETTGHVHHDMCSVCFWEKTQDFLNAYREGLSEETIYNLEKQIQNYQKYLTKKDLCSTPE